MLIWKHVYEHADENEAWFVENLRVNLATFRLVSRETYAEYKKRIKSKRRGRRKRLDRKVAMFLLYCSSADELRQLKCTFGCGKTEAQQAVELMLDLV